MTETCGYCQSRARHHCKYGRCEGAICEKHRSPDGYCPDCARDWQPEPAAPQVDTITFAASFPPIQSAIKSGRDGARIQLDIPASELPAIVRLMALAAEDSELKITVKKVDGQTYGAQKDRD